MHDSAGEFIMQIFYHDSNFNLIIFIGSYKNEMWLRSKNWPFFFLFIP